MEDAAPSLDEGARLVDRAAAWLPHVAAPVQATTLAYRVLPEDGYPAVGFHAGGQLRARAHSAITLAPVLSALAVAELAGVDVDVLEPRRPGMFGFAAHSARHRRYGVGSSPGPRAGGTPRIQCGARRAAAAASRRVVAARP